MFTKLSAPFPVDAIHWRAQSVTDKNGGAALALAYIDARDVMDRLDEVVGPENWQDSYSETAKGRLICTLSIRSANGDWIAKSDGAGNTDVEGDKGAISDAFKRTAVKWGIGRYLYDLKNVWAPCELGANNKWRSWKPEAKAKFAAALNALVAQPVAPSLITGEQLDELQLLFDHLNVPVAEFLAIAQIKRLSELPANWFDRAKTWINNRAIELRNEKKAA